MESRRELEQTAGDQLADAGAEALVRTSSTLSLQPARRHQSLTVMRTRLSESVKTAGEALRGKSRKKLSLKFWDNFKTVSVPLEESRDWGHTSQAKQKGRCCGELWTNLVTWLLPGLIGFLTATTGVLIERASDRLNGLLFGYCSSSVLSEAPAECRAGGGWVSWSSAAPPEQQDWHTYCRGWLIYVGVAAALAGVSATLVRCFAPTARGSGIPEVKTILGGFVMPEVLRFKTLVVKIVGLTFSVSSGMALGKEGPLVHVACCWANFCAKLSPRFMENEGKRRELISTAAAAGVAVAFGAPVGGVLFSYEEVSTMFPQKTMVRAFFAAVVAALTLLWYDPTGTGKLTMFEAFTPDFPWISEYPWFVLLGIMGGLIGALFVHWNVKVSAARAEGTWFRRRVPVVAEVVAIALLTAATSFPSPFTRDLSPVTIRALFHACDDAVSQRPDMMGLCADAEPLLSSGLVASLALAAVLRFLQMTATFGTGVPCGLFVPSLYTGACLGRCLGIFVRWLHASTGWLPADTVHPGVYAMVGAAAVLGGVCRVTISLVVIMYELTSALQLIVPFMLAVLTAKWSGDLFTHGIYDCYIRLRGYPYLHEPDDFTFDTRACDIMDEDLECVYADAGTLGQLLTKVSSTHFGGFPLVRSRSDPALLGYVHSAQVREHLEMLLSSSALIREDLPVVFKKYGPGQEGALDLSRLVDETVLRIVPETPLAQVHNIFRQLGIKLVLVTRFAELAGIITKKSFVHHLETGAIGHLTHDPAVHAAPPVPRTDGEGAVPDTGEGAPGPRGHQSLPAASLPGAEAQEPEKEVSPGDSGSPAGEVRQCAHRRGSLKMMRDKFLSVFNSGSPTTRLVGGGASDRGLGDEVVAKKTSEHKVKRSLRKWGKYKTVSFPTEDVKDFREHTSAVFSSGSRLERFLLPVVPWLIPALVGFLTASSGSLVEVVSDRLNDVRFGYCSEGWLQGRAECEGAWVPWTSGCAAYVGVSVLFAALSALLVWAFAPMARGSGIPEVKTILGGFVMNDVLELRTLVVKVIGLTFSVSSGMSLGKEGPLVHVACCWANFCSRLSARYMENEAKRRELISTAAAAGVSVAFGTPLGGVLFSYEEVSTMFPQKTMIRAFFAAVVAALCLGWYDPTGTGKLTMFNAHFEGMPQLSEYPWFILLGVIGGLLGALFVHWNIKVSAGRRDGTPFRKRVPVVVEVAVIALLTAVTSYPMLFTRELSSVTIRALFQSCGHGPGAVDTMGLCAEGEDVVAFELVRSLCLAALLRFLQMTVTFGTGVPCGLFVPSLYTGACVGRSLGVFVSWLGVTTAPVNPGVYAMVGAAAVLGGVCRVTISLVVIMFGLTGALQLIVPFMLAVLTAKFVGDAFGDGIYDACIILRGYPYLHEPHDVNFSARACDIVDDELDCLNAQPTTMGDLLETLKATSHGGFPLIASGTDHTLLGYVHTEPLKKHLEVALSQSALIRADFPAVFRKYAADRAPGAMDLSKFVDETVVRIVPETPLAQVHNIFRQLGVKIVLVARFGKIVGLITKKAFVDHLQEGHIGHVAHDPAVHRARDAAEVRDPPPAGGLSAPLLGP